MEQERVEIEGKLIKGSLVFITGDNLGSHELGGFIANFSTSEYLCRYCLITRNEFYREDGAYKTYTPRTIESYNDAVNLIENNSVQGIKFNSIFNKLQYFHVCAPGLPPCIGHDLFEGVVAFDLKLYIDYFILKKWFTLIELNTLIDKFHYSIEDRKDKPCVLSATSKRIIGGVCQIWTFLWIFPLLIHDKIKVIHDEVWLCFLLLTEIVEIVCSPTIHKSCLFYLDRIISEYLSMRQRFSDINLRPKHHYLSHYCKLILEFGPLIKVWTMRFESKHRFFKRTTRNLLNFINVVKSLSEKHELFQSLVRLGADSRLELKVFELSHFNIDMYQENIKAAIRKINLPDDIQQCTRVNLKGTEYRNGHALVIRQDGYQENITGRICLFLCSIENDVYAVFEVIESSFIPFLRAYELGRTIGYDCLSLHEIMDFKPMHIYNLGSMLCVKPCYGFVSHYF